jgi:hypothetical protein
MDSTPPGLASFQATPSVVQTIPFLALPPEIRIRIYRFLFVGGYDGGDKFDSSGDNEVLMPARHVIKHNMDRFSHDPSNHSYSRGWQRSSQFLRCCRTCVLEGRPILYGENTFYVDAPSAISFFVRQMTFNSGNAWIQHITLSDSWTRQISRQRYIHEIRTLHALKTIRINLLIRPDYSYWPIGSDQFSFKAFFNPEVPATVYEIQRRLGQVLVQHLDGVKVFVDACGPQYCGEMKARCEYQTLPLHLRGSNAHVPVDYVARYLICPCLDGNFPFQLALHTFHDEKGSFLPLLDIERPKLSTSVGADFSTGSYRSIDQF